MGERTHDETLPKKHSWLKIFWPFEGYEGKKALYLSGTFSCIIFAYSILKPIKDTVFLGFVGPMYLPWAKLLMIVSLPIFMPAYSAADSQINRSRAITIFTLFYGIGCLVFALLLLHPVIGLQNTLTGPGRILGWVFYAFLDFFSIAVVATFWALTNSINTPKTAKSYYGFMVATSRAAGAIAAGLGMLILKVLLGATLGIPILLITCTVALGLGVLCVKAMFKNIPKTHLLGYSDTHTHKEPRKAHVLDGLKTILTKPYTFGMFWLLCSFELISTLINYRMQCLISQSATNVTDIGTYMLGYTFVFQILGSMLALFGTTTLLKKFGVRPSLLITPIIVLVLSCSLFLLNDLLIITMLMIALRTLDYSLDKPVREILFIPTTHNIQYQVKGWIASFGKTVSKTSGSLFNGITTIASAQVFLGAITYAPVGLSFLWVGTAYIIGRKYQEAVDQGKVIGDENPTNPPQ